MRKTTSAGQAFPTKRLKKRHRFGNGVSFCAQTCAADKEHEMQP